MSQKTDAALTILADVIRNEVVLGGNTKGRVADMIQDIIDSKPNNTALTAAVAALVDASPAALDTLNELAAALGDDPNLATTLTTAIGLKANASAITNVNNTSDANKPVSTAQQTAIDLKVDKVNAAVAITDAATVDLTAIKHTLATSNATKTVTISYTGDDITLELMLNTVSSIFTFPASALCVSEGVASGNNTAGLSGVSGDKYIIGIKKIGSAYYVACKNFGQ